MPGLNETESMRGRVTGVFVVLALLTLLTGPFLLRPVNPSMPAHYDRRLVILSPHNERVRQEFGAAFSRHWRETTGETLYVDWRTPGGASEIAMFMRSEFFGAFQYFWTHKLGRAWDATVAQGYTRSAPDDSSKESAIVEAQRARAEFMHSNVGIGVDVLFGGGSYDFQQFADAGFLVSASAIDESTGLQHIVATHPDWFTEQVIPLRYSGEPFRDPLQRWTGVVLSSFGIVFNRDVLNYMHAESEPSRWADLGRPEFFGKIALSDPTKSGSVAKAFELLIQEQMQLAVVAAGEAPDQVQIAASQGLQYGWEAGLRLIQRISANARYFTDSASKIALEVARGEAAAGMAIDSYGRATEDSVRAPNGVSRVGFTTPLGGTSVSVDPIAMLRGAREPRVATAFLEFVLSEAGQKLWAYRSGLVAGPKGPALFRLPIRRDFYTPENSTNMTAPTQPYAASQTLWYRPEWTGRYLAAIRFIIRVMCIDTHREQRRAWQALIKANFPPAAVAAFHDLHRVSYGPDLTAIAQALTAKDRVREVALARELSASFRSQYEQAYELANSSVAQR
jgi:iron(III) transport system substrate-binding protein